MTTTFAGTTCAALTNTMFMLLGFAALLSWVTARFFRRERSSIINVCAAVLVSVGLFAATDTETTPRFSAVALLVLAIAWTPVWIRESPRSFTDFTRFYLSGLAALAALGTLAGSGFTMLGVWAVFLVHGLLTPAPARPE